uniref:Uncharacterized protein n=1 Tax=Agrobacterium tumefaciens TaxID=358 RepID=A0A2Z2Q4N3_AGRTU|nr:hypothetical protein [Agrobacterium radiobacter]
MGQSLLQNGLFQRGKVRRNIVISAVQKRKKGLGVSPEPFDMFGRNWLRGHATISTCFSEQQHSSDLAKRGLNRPWAPPSKQLLVEMCSLDGSFP